MTDSFQEIQKHDLVAYYPTSWPKFLMYPIVIMLRKEDSSPLRKNIDVSVQGEKSTSQLPLSRGAGSTFLNQRSKYTIWAHEDFKDLVLVHQAPAIENWIEPDYYTISKDTKWEVCTSVVIESFFFHSG